MFAAAGSGANWVAGIGSVYDAMGMSAEMMLIQNAWLDAAEFLGRGIEVSRHTLGLRNIKEAGPGGHFLTDDLTLDLLRGDEFFSNDLFDYSGAASEGDSLLSRAHDKVESIVADFRSPLPGNVQEDLRRYFAEAYHKLGRK